MGGRAVSRCGYHVRVKSAAAVYEVGAASNYHAHCTMCTCCSLSKCLVLGALALSCWFGYDSLKRWHRVMDQYNFSIDQDLGPPTPLLQCKRQLCRCRKTWCIIAHKSTFNPSHHLVRKLRKQLGHIFASTAIFINLCKNIHQRRVKSWGL